MNLLRVFIDELGEIAVLWGEKSNRSSGDGVYIATSALGSNSVRARSRLADFTYSPDAVYLGNKRYAWIRRIQESKAVAYSVDFSSNDPNSWNSVSSIIPTPKVYYNASGAPGMFLIKPGVVDKSFALGPGAEGYLLDIKISGVESLYAYENAFWLTGSSSSFFWWAFEKYDPGTTNLGIYLASVEIPSGELSPVIRLGDSSTTINTRCRSRPVEVDEGFQPSSFINIADHGGAFPRVVWTTGKNNDADVCNVFVDGQKMNREGWVGEYPFLMANAKEALLVFSERPAGNDRSELRWRRQPLGGAWSESQPLADAPFGQKHSAARSPNGSFAIAWTGCSGSGSMCLSKYTNGQWGHYTSELPITGSVRVAINDRGDAVLVEHGYAACADNPKVTCVGLKAYRF